MKSAELIRRRLANQHLTSSKFKSPAEAVSAQGAVQAQDFNDALWAPIGAWRELGQNE